MARLVQAILLCVVVLLVLGALRFAPVGQGWNPKAGTQATADAPASTTVPQPMRVSHIVAAGETLARFDGQHLAYDHRDPMGSVVAHTATEAATTQEFRLLPYGQPLLASTTPDFTGKRLDASTAWYDFSARVYAPALGRFLQTDPVLQNEQSLYGYAQANPLRYTDPDGRLSTEWKWRLIHMGVNSAAALASGLVRNDNVDDLGIHVGTSMAASLAMFEIRRLAGREGHRVPFLRPLHDVAASVNQNAISGEAPLATLRLQLAPPFALNLQQQDAPGLTVNMGQVIDLGMVTTQPGNHYDVLHSLLLGTHVFQRSQPADLGTAIPAAGYTEPNGGALVYMRNLPPEWYPSTQVLRHEYIHSLQPGEVTSLLGGLLGRHRNILQPKAAGMQWDFFPMASELLTFGANYGLYAWASDQPSLQAFQTVGNWEEREAYDLTR